MNDKIFYFQITKPWAAEPTYSEGNNNFFLSALGWWNLETQVEKTADASNTLLVVPADNSILANEVKNSPDSDIFWTTPFSNLKFKPKFLIKKQGTNSEYSCDGLLIKDPSQVKKQTGTDQPTAEITFKVLSQKKVKRTTEDPDSRCYAHELEVEPFSLGIEGIPEISRIIFDFGFGQVFENTPGTLIKTKLYNSKLLEESTGKTFKMRVKNWKRRKRDNSLFFGNKDDFDLNSFSEIISQPPKNNNDDNQTIIQVLTNAKQAIQQALKKHNLKVSDLDSKFADWEEQLKKLDSEDKITTFQQELEKEIQEKEIQTKKNKSNDFSLPVKLLIGGGVVVVLIGLVVGAVWWWKKGKKGSKSPFN